MPTMGYTHRQGDVLDEQDNNWMRASTKDTQHYGTLEVVSESIGDPCGYCNAQPNELCVNPITGRPARVPHVLHRKPPAIGS